MATFTLRMSFDGLCLFAPQLGGADPRVHVLLIKAGGGGMPDMGNMPGMGDAGAMPAHLPRLYYDASYVEQGAAEESGHLFMLPLDDSVLVVSGGSPIDAGAFPASELGQKIVDLDATSSTGKLSATQVEGALPAQCSARITFASGQPGRTGSTALWNVFKSEGDADQGRAPLGARDLVDFPEWQVSGLPADAPLVLSFMERDGTTPKQNADGSPMELRLSPVRGQVRLHVYCVPEPDLPGNERPAKPPQAGDRAPHFPAFYAMFPAATPAELRRAAAGRSGHTTRCATAQVPVA